MHIQTLEQTQQTAGRQVPQEKALDLIMGGNSTFTFKSLKSNTHITYKVTCNTRNNKEFFVSFLSGSDNTKDYTYLLKIVIDKDGIPSLQKSWKANWNSKSFEVFEFVFLHLLIKRKINHLEIWHEGRCCRCGRKLTVPESIEDGIGPECKHKAKLVNF